MACATRPAVRPTLACFIDLVHIHYSTFAIAFEHTFAVFKDNHYAPYDDKFALSEYLSLSSTFVQEKKNYSIPCSSVPGNERFPYELNPLILLLNSPVSLVA